MDNTNLFLDLYKELEEALKVAYQNKETRHTSLIMEYMNDGGKKYFDELDFCRELRNLLTHHSSFDGISPVVPSDELIAFLKKVVYEIENPPVALDIGTPAKNLTVCTHSDRVLPLLEKMKRSGFSHVPVIIKGRIAGVFSLEAAFNYQRDERMLIDESTKISDLRDYTPPIKHETEAYLFATPDERFENLKNAFEAKGPKGLRVAAIFITENGKSTGELLSMITPWDIIKFDE